MRTELITINVANENFDSRFKTMWISIRRDGTLVFDCNGRYGTLVDCHSFVSYLKDVLHIDVIDVYTCSGYHYAFTKFRIRKSGSSWRFEVGDIKLFKSLTKGYLLCFIESYFYERFSQLE